MFFSTQINSINRLMDRFKVNFSLQMRVRKYLEFAFWEKKDRLSHEESNVLENLNRELQTKVLFETYGSIVQSIPSLVTNFSNQIVNKAAGALQVLHLAPNEQIPEPEV